MQRWNMIYPVVGLLLVVLMWSSLAHADIMISPLRVVLDEQRTEATLTLRNPGERDRTYRIFWVEREMGPDGRVVVAESGVERPASSLVRHAPRRITVPAGGNQTVRLFWRPSESVANGEYRSHLMLQLDGGGQMGAGTQVMSGQAGEGVSFQLEALISFAVPVIVRKGPGEARVTFSGIEPRMVALDDGSQQMVMAVRMQRAGPFSAYGNLLIHQQIDGSSEPELIGRVTGAAIYHELDEVEYEVRLNPAVQLHPGAMLRVALVEPDPRGERLIAEQLIRLSQ